MKKRFYYAFLAFIVATGMNVQGQTTPTPSADQTTTEFKPSGNVYGYVFGDYASKTHSDSLNRGGGNVQYRGVPVNANAFQIRRAYLGYDFNIAENFSTSILLANEQGPMLQNATGDNLDAGGSNTMYLKYAFLKWKNIIKNNNLVIGQYSTCSFASPNQTEPLWSYRSIERTIMDMHNNDASSDLGISWEGATWQPSADDTSKPTFLGYVAQVGNGNSAKPEMDNFKKVRANIYVSTLQQKLIVGVYGDYNKTAKLPLYTGTYTLKAYANYKTDWFKIGAEVFQQTNINGDQFKTSAGVKDTANGQQLGISAFLSGRIIKNKLSYFARLDSYNPDTKYNSNNTYSASATGGNMTTTTFYKQTFYTLGLDYSPIPRVHIMPNIWVNQYSTMMSEVAGKALSANTKNDYDFVARITFYYIFNSSKTVANNGMNN